MPSTPASSRRSLSCCSPASGRRRASRKRRMTEPSRGSTVSIRPGVAVLSVLRHLNYRSWYALAEFVDNAIQSYKQSRSDLMRLDGPQYKLHVSIDLDAGDGKRIRIRDNAAGIGEKDYDRAFRPAEVPPDTSGLSEFGMGMKSA